MLVRTALGLTKTYVVAVVPGRPVHRSYRLAVAGWPVDPDRLVEMPRSGERSCCCGAGGAEYGWMRPL